MNMTFFVAVWAVVAVITLALAIYRKFLAMHEDDFIHLSKGENSHIPEQTELARKTAVVQHWGKILTVITLVVGLGLASVYLYQVWGQSSTAGLK